MTRLLEKALLQINELPPEQQDAIASLILDEISDDRRWDNAFANSQQKLSQLADKVRSDIQAGRTKKLGFDEL